MRPRLTVILLNWRNCDDTLACLYQLEGSSYPELRIIVVDNGSGDDSVARIRAAYPRVTLLALDRNHGFAGGVNPGIQLAMRAGSDYVLLLNSDVHFEPELLSMLVETAEADPQLGLLGPKEFRDRAVRRLALYGFRVTRAGLRLLGWNAIDAGQLDHEQIDVITGCAMLIPRHSIERVGLLDERFFFYGEDMDYGIRVRLAGLHVRVARHAEIEHSMNGSTQGQSARRQFLLASARIRVLLKHHQLFNMPVALLFESIEAYRSCWHSLRQGDRAAALGYLRGLWDGFRS